MEDTFDAQGLERLADVPVSRRDTFEGFDPS